MWRAIQKRNHKPMYKTHTKKKTIYKERQLDIESLRVITLGGTIEKSPILP